MSIIALQNPLPVLVSSGTVAASVNLQNNMANVLGFSRLIGNVFSSVAPAAGYPLVTFSTDGVTTDYSTIISVDGTKANFNYTIDLPISAPYVSVQVKDAGAGSTVRVSVYAFPVASAQSVQVNTTSNPTYSTIATYTASFNGLAAPVGQFFELVGAAGAVGRIREIQIFKPSASLELIGLQQSVASTGGTSTTLNSKNDLTSAASILTAKQYSVAPTAGTTARNQFDVKAITSADIYHLTFGDTWDQPIVVRNGGSFAMSTDVTATIYGFVRWVEAAS